MPAMHIVSAQLDNILLFWKLPFSLMFMFCLLHVEKDIVIMLGKCYEWIDEPYPVIFMLLLL